MHVLGHSFSQRRKTCKPRDLHIRKISFSGSSLSSGSSFSSSMSAASMSSSSISAPSTAASSSSSSLSPPNSASTARGPRSSRSAAGLDPLALHPTFQPPPRLCDRPLLSSPEPRRFDESTTFFLDDDEESIIDPCGSYVRHDEAVSPVVEAKMMEPDDYFGVQFTRRPAMPRSRWSESTVATVESTTPSDDDDTVHGSEEDDADRDVVDDVIGHYYYQPTKPLDGHQSMPNFSHKRDTIPKRPPIKTLDSLEDFIKRGGWKRRGIVFHQEDVDSGGDTINLF
ncbi:hypothetical protein HRG_006935 [Hirsutella rhossiliensis]|uniref:Uncharacterized protein n=1 Tax=Hirsutella rhossiliensis TaxID=111463 RepID=A0A9P8MV66_9HYPO|nr:uncharacterized protein HRG_06935 [Hirsutella rhossiliensis]KAH0961855.1 hypothetical protein HRG_06935 [Hirsutella rhossiliensis]